MFNKKKEIVVKRTTNKRDAEALDWSQLEVFLAFVKDKDIEAYNYFVVASWTGIRSAEYSQIVKIWNENKTSTFFINTTKREDRRQIVMPVLFTKQNVELIELDERQQRYQCAKWIKKVINAGLIEERLLSPHDLRATFITGLINRGLEAIALQSITKHKKIENLLIYFKRNPKKIKHGYKLLEYDEWDVDNNPVLLEKALWKERQRNIELKEKIKELEAIHG